MPFSEYIAVNFIDISSKKNQKEKGAK